MLTAVDKFWFAALVVLSLLGAAVTGAVLVAYLSPLLADSLRGTGRTLSPTEALLFVLGCLVGYTAVLAVFGTLSRRCASSDTQRRWVEYVNDIDFDSGRGRSARRYAEFLLRVLVPANVHGL